MKTTLALVSSALLLSACVGAGDSAPTPSPTTSKANTNALVDVSLFNSKAMESAPEIVDCTLENGDQTQCAKLVVKYMPDDLKIGPFCPDTLEDKGGLWDWDGEKPGLYRIDKAFLQMLDTQGYTFYDEAGNVQTVDNATSPPTVDHACINVTANKSVKVTALIPLNPVMAESTTALGTVAKVGMALEGVPIFSDAPSVKERGHLPALDTCAGHIDPGGWYHYHATSSDINTVFKHEHVDADCTNLTQDPAALFGYGFDGVPIYGSVDANGSAPTDLDECRGHVGTLGESTASAYHYHSSTDFPNLPQCLKGVVAQDNFSTTGNAGIGSQGLGGGKGPKGGDRTSPPGFGEAAIKLHITEKALMTAMQAAGGPRADLSKVADSLGVSIYALKEALPKRPGQ